MTEIAAAEVLEGEIVDEVVAIDYRPPPKLELTKHKRKSVLDAISQRRVHLSTAAKLAGVPARALAEAVRHGEDFPQGPYGRLAVDIRRAEGEVEAAIVDKMYLDVEQHKDWKARMTFAERRFSENWRRPAEGANVQVNVGFNAVMEQVRSRQGDNALPTGD